MQVEEKYMRRCLELAKSGRPAVAPNPLVGAVIVHKGQIIGEGFHRQYGGAHAELNAIQAVRDETLLRDSTLYVNLEPCAHEGKTPPCTSLILQKQIPRVVVGSLDPFPQVAGRGVRILRDVGVDVVTDVMKQEAMALNRFFMTAQTKQRPYIILKWAQSQDGYIDRCRQDASEKPVQFSTPATRRHVHKLRSEVSAIMVGTHTAWMDNPSLTVRHWSGNSPVRVFPDRTLRIPPTYHLLDGSVGTLVLVEGSRFKVQGSRFKVSGSEFKGQGSKSPFEGGRGMSSGHDSRCIMPSPLLKGAEECQASEFQCFGLKNHENIEYIAIDFSRPVIPQMLHALYERKLYSLLVEGGARLHQHFLDFGLWDEVHIETAPIKLGNGVKAPTGNFTKTADIQKDIVLSAESFQMQEPAVISVYICNNL